MALTNAQLWKAYKELTDRYNVNGSAGFTKPELKQALVDAEAWVNTPSVKQSFNDSLTNGNFKTNASANNKAVVLALALINFLN